MARLASASSSADMSSKSISCSTSWGEKVSTASSSISTFSWFSSSSGRRGVMASLARRLAGGASGWGSLSVPMTGPRTALSSRISRQNSRNAWSKRSC